MTWERSALQQAAGLRRAPRRMAVALACAALLSPAACGPLSGAPVAGDAHAGQHAFAVERCAQCHRFNGEGGTSAADLTNNITFVNYDLLKSYMVDDPPSQMAYLATFHVTPRQLSDLTAFATSSLRIAQLPRKPKPAVATGRARPIHHRPTPVKTIRHGPTPVKSKSATRRRVTTNPAQLGARLFVADRCSQCHQVNGVGGTIGADLTHRPSATSVSALQAAFSQNYPGMGYVGSLHLTAAQLRALAAFCDSSLQPAG